MTVGESQARRLISFSLYGNLPLYLRGAVANAELTPRYYPGWTARFYHDATVPAETLAALRDRGAELRLVIQPPRGACHGRFWRLMVAADLGVERFILRDADSRLNSREVAAVDAWIASGRRFHLMRDHIWHNSRMLCGMWGGLGGCLPDIAAQVAAWEPVHKPGDNDRFMAEVIYPIAARDMLCHDDLNHFGDAVRFPPHSALQGTSHVGEIVTPEVEAQDPWRRIVEVQIELIRAKTEAQQILAAVQSEVSQLRCQVAETEAMRGSRAWRTAQRLRQAAWRLRQALGLG